MDLSSKPSWSRRNPSTTPLGNERRESASDPPPYYLHDVKSPGNVTFIDPWNSRVPPAHASAIEHNEISPATSMSPPPHRSHNNSDDLPLHIGRLQSARMSRRGSWHRLSVRLVAFGQSEPFWLALYFLFNLGLTLYNKMVLVTFPFPYTLTAMHALWGSIGCYTLHEYGFYSVTLLGFSVLYAVNIAVSNLSLQLVTIPFHQVVRAASPLFTIMLAYFIMGATASRVKIFSLLPVVAGVGFTTYGDYYFTYWGLILTLFGTFLASLKTIVTNLLQNGNPKRRSIVDDKSTARGTGRMTMPGSGLKLHPLDLLGRMSPLAFIQCVIYGWASGELDGVSRFGATHMDSRRLFALCINGMIAFGLNVVSFTANKKSGPLSISVAANVKQVLTVLLAVFIFNLVITPMNMVGIVLTLGGGAWYAAVEYKEKAKKRSLESLTSVQHRPHPVHSNDRG
ncbi:hypothetical protein M408DRAFT_16507 [Serendipita vermifera MAFF 305830]|uniref:Sugar phosphate transporter domain-containing protein n=1 Tax=Serendipita vermifera MAFF 305830 TaxID=933852 RepID=A0A0C2XFN8_SERVB|nr:hypothetical protein M408DRAFT_16507 [Serendipita vermifera MAFF 305830]